MINNNNNRKLIDQIFYILVYINDISYISNKY